MSERKIWKAEEDQILKELFEVRRIKKWSEISRIMETTYGVEGRNGKQCRERYHNHLKCGINKDKWSPEEEAQLVELHALYGNRWALISKLIPGRTENCVKNMLYSKLRKAIRQLNRFSYEYYRKTLKEIKISFIYRLIEFTENSYRSQENQRNQQEITALRLKNDILTLELEEGTELDQPKKERIRKLVEDIHTFKRVNQRFRGGQHSKGGKRGRVKKEEEEDVHCAFKDDEVQFNDDCEESEEEQMEEEQADERVETAQKQEQLSSKTKQQSKQGGIKEGQTGQIKEHQLPTLSLVEGGRRSKILRMDSLESNLSLLLVDSGLENPIRTQHQFLLTPTPKPPGIVEDWNVLSNNWRNSFTFD